MKNLLRILSVILLLNLALALAQTNTNTVPAVPTEEVSHIGALLVGAITAVSALVVGVIAWLKKKKPPAA